MTLRTEILSRFHAGGVSRPFYLPDLTLWYKWHHNRGTLPSQWQGCSLPQVARALGAPVWAVARPWRVATPGVELQVSEGDGERTARWQTTSGVLTARWTLGPDGDWWQVEHLIKDAEDLPAALELAGSRTYVFDAADYEGLEAAVGEDGVVALELPRRPYSDLLHEFLGWGDGLLLLGESGVLEILDILESALRKLLNQVTRLPGSVVLCPDNLDGQFISPTAFQTHMADSYRHTADVLHSDGHHLVVHVGGPVRHLLPYLAATGLDGIEGICGPPQSDASLVEARALVGLSVTLWGGISQDHVLGMHDVGTFEQAVMQAVQEAMGDGRMILGVVDRVPVDADLQRLEAIPSLIERALAT